ncbi:hypothetical protein ACB092_12G101400 [Castanea dentata]
MSLKFIQLHFSGNADAIEHIKVGSFYEIDHSKLTPQTPEQLNSIRVVMVSEKAEFNVAVRYPSTCSLRTHFSNGNCEKPEGKKLPALNETYIMDSELAGEVLYRRLTTQEIAEKRNSWSFWVVPCMEAEKDSDSGPASRTRLRDAASKKGMCSSVVNLTGMVQWGKRKRVRFLARHEEQKVETLSMNVKDKEVEEEGKGKGKWKEEEEGGGDDDEDEDEVEEVDGEALELESSKAKKNIKRKCHGSRRAQMPKRAKREKKQSQIQVHNQSKKKKIKNSIERWSVDRYKLAEVNILKIMKDQKAVFGNPILRPALRTEARKLVGDTGLLDHLLKHMAGKVAPGGEERFRRRHNSEGAMEYWLESADLLNLRRDAGIQDPYWIPPPGWKPGDDPSQDAISTRELGELKEEMAKMKKNIQELVTKKQEENLPIATTPNSSVTCLNRDHEEGSLIPLKEMYTDWMNRKAKVDKEVKELMKISQYLSGMEEKMGMLKSAAAEETIMPESEVPPLLLIGSPTTPSHTIRETKDHLEPKNKSGEEQEDKGGDKAAVTTATEDKAAKIKKLKSGFRICKPQGSFLWPKSNMMTSPQSMVHLEDHLVVSTPPSASSTTLKSHLLPPYKPHLGPHPTSPVKPLAERRPVSNAILQSVITKPSTSPLPPETPQTQSITTSKNSLINLNEPPQTQQSDTDTAYCGTITYQRKHFNLTSIAPMPHFEMVEKDEETESKDVKRNPDEQKQQTSRGSSSSTSNSSWLTTGEGWWLGLASPKPSLDKSNKG